MESITSKKTYGCCHGIYFLTASKVLLLILAMALQSKKSEGKMTSKFCRRTVMDSTC